MSRLTRLFTFASALAVLAFEMAASAHALPAAQASPPFLDGRPVMVAVAPAPRWMPGSEGEAVWVRFGEVEDARYGIIEGEAVLELATTLFESPRPNGRSHALEHVALLAPVTLADVGTVLIGPLDGDTPPAPLPIDAIVGPDREWRAPDGVAWSYRRWLAVVPWVGGASRTAVGRCAAILLEVEDGPATLALGPTLAARPMIAEPDTTRARLTASKPGTVFLEPLDG